MKYPHCKKSLWQLDILKHVETDHLEKEYSVEGIISKAGKWILHKKQARVANALSVKGLEQLDEEKYKLCH